MFRNALFFLLCLMPQWLPAQNVLRCGTCAAPTTLTVQQAGRPTSVQQMERAGFRCKAQQGMLQLTAPKSAHLRVYDLSGRPIVDSPCRVGDNAFALPASGLYLLSLLTSDGVVKQWVRLP